MRCSRYVKWDNILKSRLLLQPPNVQKSLKVSDFSIFSCTCAKKAVPLQRIFYEAWSPYLNWQPSVADLKKSAEELSKLL